MAFADEVGKKRYSASTAFFSERGHFKPFLQRFQRVCVLVKKSYLSRPPFLK
jgi:hypothetical protein